MISKSNIYIFFRDFTNNRKKTSRAITFCSEPCPDILNYGEQNFLQSGEQDYFTDILKSSADMYQSSG